MTRQKKLLLIVLATTCTPLVAIGCNSMKTTQGGEDAQPAPPVAPVAPAVAPNIAPLTSATTTVVELQRPTYVRPADGGAARIVAPDGATIWALPSGFPTAIPPLPSVFPSTLPPMPSFKIPPMPAGFPTALPSTWPTALPSAAAPKN